jgi:hypothetical protein
MNFKLPYLKDMVPYFLILDTPNDILLLTSTVSPGFDRANISSHLHLTEVLHWYLAGLKEMRTYVPDILALLKEAKSSGYLALARLKAALQIPSVDDIEKYSENVIQHGYRPTDFYQDHLTMLYLRRN